MWPPFVALRTPSLLRRSAARSCRFATGTSSACMSIPWSASSIVLSSDLGSESCVLSEVMFPCWTSRMLIIAIGRGSPLRSLGRRLQLVLMLFLVLFLRMSDQVLVVPLWWLISSTTCACVNTFVFVLNWIVCFYWPPWSLDSSSLLKNFWLSSAWWYVLPGYLKLEAIAGKWRWGGNT